MGRFDNLAQDFYLARPAGVRRQAARFKNPYGPKPFIDPDALLHQPIFA
jgi:hypothetical protein